MAGAKAAVALILALRFGLPLLFFRYPFQASWSNFVLDTVDGDILVPLGLDPSRYQAWDKAADWVAYAAMLAVGLRWEIRHTIAVLFAWRSVGQLLYFLTGRDVVFIAFPNLLEPLFMIYSLLLFREQASAGDRYRRHRVAIWLLIVAYKMWNEWNIHVARIDLSEAILGIWR